MRTRWYPLAWGILGGLDSEVLATSAAIGSAGAVLGVDIGFSDRRKSTGLCLLRWNDRAVGIDLALTGSGLEERRRSLLELVPKGTRLDAVAIDGPLTHGLRLVDRYRAADALLSSGAFQKRGKPGQTSAPIGRKLHAHATDFARLLLAMDQAGDFCLAPSDRIEAIHDKAIVEAFPNLFLAALIPEAELPAIHRDASDRYWEALVARGGLEALLGRLIPAWELPFPFSKVRDHDERAAVVCALTALCVAAGQFVGVGDPVDGDIILPPIETWGSAVDSHAPWMESALRASLPKVRSRGGMPVDHRQARVVASSGRLPWAAESLFQ